MAGTNGVPNGTSANDYNMWLARAQGMSEWGSSASNQARDQMENGFNLQQILGTIMQIFKILGSLSG